MVRIPTDPLAVREDTLQDLRDEFLVRCHAKNLSARTIEWYEKHTELFIEWCRGRGVTTPAELSTTLLEEYLIDARAAGRTPNTVRGYAQTHGQSPIALPWCAVMGSMLDSAPGRNPTRTWQTASRKLDFGDRLASGTCQEFVGVAPGRKAPAQKRPCGGGASTA